MKIINKILGTGLLAILLLLVAPNKSKAQDGDYISDQQFYDDLQPYGTWVSDPQYGNVWIPDAEDDFRPYASRGHWVVTDYGNTWVSDYPWGWATFHYGRWRYDDYYGWEWIPGHEWAPAWVSWRHGGGYYGWAPLQPGISISISIGGGGGYNVPDNYWVCAPQAYINRPNIYNYYAPPSRSVTIIRNTTIINNTYVNNNVTYVTGPRPQEIQNITHQRVQVYKINNVNRPTTINRIQNNTVNIYRPSVTKAPDARPARVIDGAAYRKQNPNQAIAHRGSAGAPAFNHANAAKLATIAKATNPNNSVVHVNNVVHRPENTLPGHPANNPKVQQTQQAQQKQQQVQQTQQRQQQVQQTQQKQQQAQQRQQQAQQTQQKQQQVQQVQQKQQQVQETQQRQQQAQQAQQAQQRQQQAQQRQQQAQQTQQKQQQIQQTQQRQQQAQQAQQAQQRQQQAQQAQQAQQRQQQAQQAQQRQQQAQQAQQRQQQAQQAQQRQQQAQQAQQRQQAQQAQQRQQQAQQAQQRQQQAQQAQQRQQHQQQQRKPQPEPPQKEN